MGFWWYFKWPEEVRKHTLTIVRSNTHGQFVSINMLEYASMLINYAAASHFYSQFPNASDPFPKVLFFADNTAAESWMLKVERMQQLMDRPSLGPTAVRHDDWQHNWHRHDAGLDACQREGQQDHLHKAQD